MNFTKVLAGALVLSACAQAPEQKPAMDEANAVVKLLQAGGYVIVFRHGGTNRDMADTDPLNLNTWRSSAS
jgi:hypothetical protein